MKSLSLEVDYSDITLAAEDKDKSPVALTAEILRGLIFGYANQIRGLSESDRKKVYDISDFLETVIKNPQNFTGVQSLDDTWVGFIKKCKREGKFIPSPLLRKIEDLIDSIQYK